MKIRSVTIITLAFVAFAGASAICAQAEEKKAHEKGPVNADDVLAKLFSSPKSKRSMEKLNGELIIAIKERGVDFVLFDGLVKEIKERGGSEAMLTAIEDAWPKDGDAWFKDFKRLETMIRYYYPKIDTRRLAVEAGRELIDKYNDERYGCSDFVQWVKVQLPKWAEQVEKYNEWPDRPAKPKPKTDQPHRR
ncbi:MAG: hypothetical protein AB7Q37_10555 [Pyrinomonadaceae bacterium]